MKSLLPSSNQSSPHQPKPPSIEEPLLLSLSLPPPPSQPHINIQALDPPLPRPKPAPHPLKPQAGPLPPLAPLPRGGTQHPPLDLPDPSTHQRNNRLVNRVHQELRRRRSIPASVPSRDIEHRRRG